MKQIEDIKRELRNASLELLDLQKNYDVPLPDASLEGACGLLEKNDFNIAICGAASQGKSTFINALMGKNLLPANEHPTTSQLFRISNSDKETFFFVFVDGTRKQFDSADEMYTYGTVLNGQKVREGKLLDYIEINTPLNFIPDNVHIWDTPGLNVTHFSHSEITARCISYCDAVIFLSAPKAPFDENELKFISSVYNYTDNILFIQSRTDEYSGEACTEKAGRNIEILTERFGKLLETQYNSKPKFSIFPLSSTNLLKSVTESDSAVKATLFKRSHFAEIQRELSALIFKTVGYSAAWSVCYAYSRYHARISESVGESRKLLMQVSRDEKLRMQNAKKQKQDDFNLKWGESGYLYKELVESISKVIRSGLQQSQQLFASGGTLQQDIIESINALPDNDREINAFAESIADMLPEKISQEWQRITNETKAAIGKVFLKFQGDFNHDTIVSPTLDFSGELDYREHGMAVFEHVRNSSVGGSVGTSIGLAVGTAARGAGWLLAPYTWGISAAVGEVVQWAAPIIGGLWGAKSSLRIGQENHARVSKNDLIRAVNAYFMKIQKVFTCSEIGEESQIDAFFGQLKDATTQTCKSIIQREKDNLLKDYQEIEKNASLGVEETAAALKQKEAITLKLVSGKNNMQNIAKRLNILAEEFSC